MKKNLLLPVSLCFSLLFCLALPVAFADSTSVFTAHSQPNIYSISSAFEYVVKPNTQEWKKLTSTEEKVKVSQIPDFILSEMTTNALVETVLNYPLLPTMYVFNTSQEGFNAVYSSFNGLQELVKRPDALIELKQKQNKIGYIKATNTAITVQGIYIETLLEGIYSKRSANFSSAITPSYTMSSVKTPMGTRVATFVDLTWADHNTTENEALYVQAQIQALYPNAALLSPVNPSYNCHSYTWYSTSSSNNHWMTSASAYRIDGSYTSGAGMVGSKVDYGAADHSGIVTYVEEGSETNVKVQSKWGKIGAFDHNILDCPYTMNSYLCTFWN